MSYSPSTDKPTLENWLRYNKPTILLEYIGYTRAHRAIHSSSPTPLEIWFEAHYPAVYRAYVGYVGKS